MIGQLAKARVDLRASFWLRPLALLLAGAALGFAVPLVERHFLASWEAPAALRASPSGARALLSSAAGTLATTLTITISMAMVTVQLAASQYTPRVIRRFLSDRGMQYVVGIFLATIAFLFLVLRSVRSPDEGEAFVPDIATTLGLAVSLACLALLVLFVHRTMRSVQASTVISGIGVAAIRTIENLHRRASVAAQPPALRASMVVTAPHTGYVQLIQHETLARCGGRRVRIVLLEVVPGDFRIAGERLATIELNGPDAPADGLARDLQAAFAMGRERTMEDDPVFAVRQLVDIALRALSPSLNDPTTAVMVIHELGAVLAAVWRRGWWADGWIVTRHAPCVVAQRHQGLPSYVGEALLELTRAVREHPRVAASLLDTTARVARAAPPCAGDRAARELLLERAALIRSLVSTQVLDRFEREALERAWAALDSAVTG